MTMAPPDWASLPSDLVRRVADVFLDTSEVEFYTSLRAVCRNWRVATVDPRGPDPRFSPRGWVLVASLAGDDHSGCRCLFIHVDSGRLLWKDMPMLCNYSCVASTEDGHLILEPASRNSRICLLNPITGHPVHFPTTGAQFFGGSKFGLQLGRNMFGAGTSPMVLYSHFDSVSGGCIDPSWDDVVFNREMVFRVQPSLGMFAAMVPFKGRAYIVYNTGSVAVVEHNCRMDDKPVVTTIFTNEWDWMHHRRVFLVDNAGELLLVRFMGSGELLVFRVDIENKVLEQIKSVRNRAIFLGKERCISVDPCNLPAIESNCLYYIGYSFSGVICVHRLSDGSYMELSESSVRGFDEEVGIHWPKSLARVLLEYACYGIRP